MATGDETITDRPIRLLIADDQALYREGLCDLIAHWHGFSIVGMCANGQEAVDAYRKLQPDLVLLDVRMPVMSGVQAAQHILGEFPAARVVMMAISNECSGLTDAVQLGACGYFLKSISPQQLQHLLFGWAGGSD